MLDFYVQGNTLPDAYHKALTCLLQSDSLEISVTMKVLNPLAEPRISRLFPGGFYELEQYRQEMLDGILDFEIGDKWHYTYHQRYAPYLPGCIKELRRDPNTRRAVISIRDNDEDEDDQNPACMQSIQFMIRHGALDMFVYFRSNDGVRAAFMNAFALIELQKRVAEILGVSVGEYTHRANSFHCYPESVETLAKYVTRILSGGATTYHYDGHYSVLMEESKPAIAQMVKEQREKHDTQR